MKADDPCWKDAPTDPLERAYFEAGCDVISVAHIGELLRDGFNNVDVSDYLEAAREARQHLREIVQAIDESLASMERLETLATTAARAVPQ